MRSESFNIRGTVVDEGFEVDGPSLCALFKLGNAGATSSSSSSPTRTFRLSSVSVSDPSSSSSWVLMVGTGAATLVVAPPLHIQLLRYEVMEVKGRDMSSHGGPVQNGL